MEGRDKVGETTRSTPPPLDEGEIADDGALRTVRSKGLGRWAVLTVLTAALVSLAVSVIDSPNIDHHTIRTYLFDHRVLVGLWHTVLLTFVAMALAIVLGTLAAALRVSRSHTVRTYAAGYVVLIRSVPVLLQLILWYNFALLFPRITVGIPGTSLTLASWQTNSLISAFTASVLALGIAESAYYSEIVRSGILSVDRGQIEAARALALTPWQLFRVVLLPQAMRVIIPPSGNELIGMLKMSSLASVISYTELAGSAESIYSQNLKTIELLLVITFWYLVLASLLGVAQLFLERHYAKGSTPLEARSPWRTIWRVVSWTRKRSEGIA